MDLRRIMALLIAALAAVTPMISDAAERDHDIARRALENREIRPLAEILAVVRDQLSGELVGIELERKREKWIYEFKTIKPGGQKIEVFVDALTGQIISPEGD